MSRSRPRRRRSSPTDSTTPHTVVAAPEAPATRSPERRCIVTGESKDRGSLLRFVVAPDGVLVPDVAGRLPGRGLWLTAQRDIVDRALAKRGFARAARRLVAAPPDLADRGEALLAQRCCDALRFVPPARLAV